MTTTVEEKNYEKNFLIASHLKNQMNKNNKSEVKA